MMRIEDGLPTSERHVGRQGDGQKEPSKTSGQLWQSRADDTGGAFGSAALVCDECDNGENPG
jgi:hypothetical protein